jgi:CRISPR-associated protein Cas4
VTDGAARAGREHEIPLSALEHYAYCRRQAALIHVEAAWDDSSDTVRGDLSHATVDLPGVRRRPGVVVVRSLPVWSDQHQLRGVCDVVEFEGQAARPVEYKVGRHVPGGPAELQVAGQALCLIEAGFTVPEAFVYSVAERRRHLVPIDTDLLNRVVATARAIRELLRADTLAPARNDGRCPRCSLKDLCLPNVTDRRRSEPVHLFQPRPLGDWDD